MRPPGVAVRGDGARSPSSPRRRFRPVAKTKGPWLIWSHYWGRWHRRGSDGGACGYTDDIAQAGVFEFEKARAYHDWPGRYGRNEAVPVTVAADRLTARLDEMDADRAALADKIALVAARATGPASPLGNSGNTPDQDQRP